MTKYELKLEKFQGPLDKLLELIEEKKLEIAEISLAEVTGDFLEYLKKLEEPQGGETKEEYQARLRTLADFIAIASRLILIKSKSLLPDAPLTSDEEAEIKDLEARLKIYRALKPIMKLLQIRWKENVGEFSRPYFLNASFPRAASGANIFFPGANLTLDSLVSSVQKVAAVVQKLAAEEETVAKEIVSVEEKIKEIFERLQKFSEVSFSHLSGSKTRPEIIVAFLAILHMAHEQLIFLEQKSHFSDIIIKHNASDANNMRMPRN
ncbi:MAG: segregation/condensation protein A [Candidatus Liptonbacteria bacterium]|nr:segregation/condensation protein A [Candidatus Liptonbacteria bacterium]